MLPSARLTLSVSGSCCGAGVRAEFSPGAGRGSNDGEAAGPGAGAGGAEDGGGCAAPREHDDMQCRRGSEQAGDLDGWPTVCVCQAANGEPESGCRHGRGGEGGDLLGQLESISLKQLDVDLDVGKIGLKDAKAVRIDRPGETLGGPALRLPDIGITFDTELDTVASIGETLLGKAKGTLIPAHGTLHVEQSIGLASGLIHSYGLVTLSDFNLAMKDVRFAEKQVEVRHDLVWDGGKSAVRVDNLTLELAGSKALTAVVSGAFGGIGSDALTLAGAKVEIQPDWAKLWPLVRPMMPPDKQKDMADLQIGGKKGITILADGVVALGQPPREMLKNLKVECDLLMESVDWPSKGVKVEGFALPVDIVGSVVYTKHQSGSGNPEKTATVNEGVLDIMDLKLEVFEPHPRLSAPPTKQIVKGIKLNNVLATALASMSGSMIDAKRAQGSVDVTLLRCERFPLDDLMKSHAKENDGRVDVGLSVTDLDVTSDSLENVMKMHWLQECRWSGGECDAISRMARPQ